MLLRIRSSKGGCVGLHCKTLKKINKDLRHSLDTFRNILHKNTVGTTRSLFYLFFISCSVQKDAMKFHINPNNQKKERKRERDHEILVYVILSVCACVRALSSWKTLISSTTTFWWNYKASDYYNKKKTLKIITNKRKDYLQDPVDDKNKKLHT